MESLETKNRLIEFILNHYADTEVFQISNLLDIEKYTYYSASRPSINNVSDFIDVVNQREKIQALVDIITSDSVLKRDSFLSEKLMPHTNLDSKMTKIFADIYLELIEKIPETKEKEFDESELFDPLEFDEKMKEKAKFSEDRIKMGILLKSDISVLRRKANNLNYLDYESLRKKISRFYLNYICEKYPPKLYSADIRFKELFKIMYSMVVDKFDDTDDLVEGIIYDTISQCLIFND